MSQEALSVLFEDNHLIAVYKPAGVLTQGDHTGDVSLMDMTKQWIKEKHKKPGNVFLGLVQRLDRPVAGVVLFAKTSKGASRLCEQFRGREVGKSYLALVEGVPTETHATVNSNIGWNQSSRAAYVSTTDSSAKESELIYEVIGKKDKQSLLRVNPKSGRKHQIRVQLGSVGHPIVGDTKYGAHGNWKKGEIGLICEWLEFTHPTQKEKVLKIELPQELNPFKEWLQ